MQKKELKMGCDLKDLQNFQNLTSLRDVQGPGDISQAQSIDDIIQGNSFVAKDVGDIDLIKSQNKAREFNQNIERMRRYRHNNQN